MKLNNYIYEYETDKTMNLAFNKDIEGNDDKTWRRL